MRAKLHARFVALTSAAAFAVAAVFFTLWLFLDSLNPPGVDPRLQLAAIEVRETGRAVGAPISWISQAPGIAGVIDFYAARPTRVSVAMGAFLSEVGAAYVNDRHFQALGVAIEGPGFDRFEPWQRQRLPQCILAPELALQLGEPLETIDVNGSACQVVGKVLSGYSGLRPPRREVLWISWHAIGGMMEPEPFLEHNYRAREAGLVLDGTRSLDAIGRDLQARLASRGFDAARVTLSPGDGLEPAEQRRMFNETRRLFVATLTVILVIGAFLLAAAGWRMELDRSELALRLVLGASRRRLVFAAVSESARVFGASLLVGTVLAVLGYRALLSVLPTSPSTDALLPQWPTVDGGLAALTALMLTLGAALLSQARGIWSLPENSLQPQLSSFRSTAMAENIVTGTVIGTMFFATLQLASLWLEQHRLGQSDGVYTNVGVLAITQQPARTMAQARQYRAPDVSPDPLIAALMANFGTENVALSGSLPYRPVMISQPVVPPDGVRTGGGVQVRTNPVSDGFFRLLGVSFSEGRPFDTGVNEEIVLDESAAGALLGPPPWVGARVRFNAAAGPLEKTVVGVVPNLPLLGRTEEPEPTIYVPLRSLTSAYNIAIRADPAHVAAVVPPLLAEHGIHAPLQPIASLYALQREAESFQRFRTRLVLVACAVALFLGLLGLRAVLASVLQRRHHEVAIKLALGARRSSLLWDAVRRGSVAALVGMTLAAVAFAAGADAWLGMRDATVAESAGLAFAAIGLLLTTTFAALLPQLRLLSQLQLSRTLASQ